MDSRSILGALLGAGVGRSGGGTTSRRLEHAIGPDGSGGSLGGILRDLSAGSGGLGGGGGSVARGPAAGAGTGGGLGGLGDLLGGGGRAGGGGLGGALGGGGGLGGLGGLLGSVLGGGAGGGGLGGALGGALGGGGGRMSPVAAGGLGSLAGAVLGARRGNPMRGAVGAGAIAVLGSMALEALARRNQQAAAAGGTGAGATHELDPTAVVPENEADQERLAGLLLRAMMSAAKADGQIDGNEMQRIMGKLDEAGADQETKNIVLDEMRRPLDIKGLAAEARRPEVAAQVYAASLLAIEVDTQAERDYLQRLASALGLDAATVARLHETLGAPAYG